MLTLPLHLSQLLLLHLFLSSYYIWVSLLPSLSTTHIFSLSLRLILLLLCQDIVESSDESDDGNPIGTGEDNDSEEDNDHKSELSLTEGNENDNHGEGSHGEDDDSPAEVEESDSSEDEVSSCSCSCFI